MNDWIQRNGTALKLALLVAGAVAVLWWWSSDPPVRVGESPGPESRVLILLHGHGASKTDLEPLAQQLADVAPGMTFIMPSAPHRVGMGRTWYPSFSADSQEEVDTRLLELRAEARDVVTEIVDGLIDDGVPVEEIYVGGFSQGATVALDVVLETPDDVMPGGLVSLSGGAFVLDLSSLNARPALRVFVSHGKRDGVLGSGRSRDLVAALDAAGHEVEFVHFDGGHAIPVGVIERLGDFLAVH